MYWPKVGQSSFGTSGSIHSIQFLSGLPTMQLHSSCTTQYHALTIHGRLSLRVDRDNIFSWKRGLGSFPLYPSHISNDHPLIKRFPWKVVLLICVWLCLKVVKQCHRNTWTTEAIVSLQLHQLSHFYLPECHMARFPSKVFIWHNQYSKPCSFPGMEITGCPPVRDR